MSSSFGILNTAYTGLVAARQGLDVVGQNITNATTDGYARQQIRTASIGAVSESLFTGGIQAGQGVTVNGISRVANPLIDGQVRSSAAADGYATQQSSTMDAIEASLGEPGSTGLSTTLQQFWTDWQGVSNQPGVAAPATTVIADGKQIAGQLAAGYSALTDQWASIRSNVNVTVSTVNQTATQIAALNGQIRQTLAGSGNANNLIDQRDALATTLARLAGGSVRSNSDGTIDVLLGGNALVGGTTVHALVATGATAMVGATASPVTIGFADNPTATTGISSGTLGAQLAALAPSNGSGTGGAIAESAQRLNAIATSVATSVNSIHQTGATTTGVTGLSFFSLDASQPAALGLGVIPTDASGIAAGTPGAGAKNGAIADQLAQLGTSASGPDNAWADFVVSIGVAAKAATNHATLTTTAAASAVTSQQSVSSVDTDQETTMMLSYQHSFEGAARVMTAVDSMLNTLINHTGLVGL